MYLSNFQDHNAVLAWRHWLCSQFSLLFLINLSLNCYTEIHSLITSLYIVLNLFHLSSITPPLKYYFQLIFTALLNFLYHRWRICTHGLLAQWGFLPLSSIISSALLKMRSRTLPLVTPLCLVIPLLCCVKKQSLTISLNLYSILCISDLVVQFSQMIQGKLKSPDIILYCTFVVYLLHWFQQFKIICDLNIGTSIYCSN